MKEKKKKKKLGGGAGESFPFPGKYFVTALWITDIPTWVRVFPYDATGCRGSLAGWTTLGPFGTPVQRQDKDGQGGSEYEYEDALTTRVKLI